MMILILCTDPTKTILGLLRDGSHLESVQALLRYWGDFTDDERVKKSSWMVLEAVSICERGRVFLLGKREFVHFCLSSIYFLSFVYLSVVLGHNTSD